LGPIPGKEANCWAVAELMSNFPVEL